MARQWLRRLRVTVSGAAGSAVFEGSQDPEPGFAISFAGTKTIGCKQNTFEVTIWNLAKSTRNMLGAEYDTIKVEAGYKETGLSLIFTGAIRDVHTTKPSPDIETKISCGDGDDGVNKGAVSKTFPKGTKPKAIVEHVVGEMPKTEMGQMVGLDDLPAYTRPVSVWGWAFSALDQIGREHAFYWSIQNGRFQAVKNDRHLGGNVLVSVETGMIGTPQVTDKGVQVKCLLNPEILPGKTIDVRSDFLDAGSGRDKRASDDGGGLFRVNSVAISGHSRDTDWYCDVAGNRIQGDKVVK